MKKTLTALLLCMLLCVFVVPAQAMILWEQLPVIGGETIVDQEFPDFPSYSTYLVNDVVVGGGEAVEFDV